MIGGGVGESVRTMPGLHISQSGVAERREDKGSNFKRSARFGSMTFSCLQLSDSLLLSLPYSLHLRHLVVFRYSSGCEKRQ